MPNVYIYVIDRDFGFAPNPFHGVCTLATCKPRIRNAAQIGDWVIGIGGSRIKATGKCIFAMRITRKITFNEYWKNPEFNDKKPVRNGSKKMMVGDNIYYYNLDSKEWSQAPSHHSLPDGSVNKDNRSRDTQSQNVLISNHFYYFGCNAPLIPEKILMRIGYKNGINHRKFSHDQAKELIDWLERENTESLNLVVGDPFNFDNSEAHYSVKTNRVTLSVAIEIE
jgi:hypothetical protein